MYIINKNQLNNQSFNKTHRMSLQYGEPVKEFLGHVPRKPPTIVPIQMIGTFPGFVAHHIKITVDNFVLEQPHDLGLFDRIEPKNTHFSRHGFSHTQFDGGPCIDFHVGHVIYQENVAIIFLRFFVVEVVVVGGGGFDEHGMMQRTPRYRREQGTLQHFGHE